MRLLLVCLLLVSFEALSTTIAKIRVAGNTRTKTTFILRHLTFEEGDTLNEASMEPAVNRSKANLQATSLFSEIDLQILPVDSQYVEVLVNVVERWYFWPLPDFKVYETNFNTWLKSPDLRRASYGLNLVKMNIAGRGIELLALARLGYVKAGGLELRFPFVGSPHIGLTLHGQYAQQAELVYATADNLRLFYRNSSQKDVLAHTRGHADFYYKPRLNRYLRIRGGFHNMELVDTLAELNNYFPRSANHAQWVETGLQWRMDERDNVAYPLTGWYFDAEWQNTIFLDASWHPQIF